MARSFRQKFLIYLLGVGLGLLIVNFIARNRPERGEHPWHAQTAPEGYYPRTFTDDVGRAVTLESQPRWFVSLAPSVTEMLFTLELGDHLMAVTEWCRYPELANTLRESGRSVGSLDAPNIEQIFSYQPDLILATTFTPQSVIEQLHRPPDQVVVVLQHDNLTDVQDDLRQIAILAGVPQFGLRTRQAMEARQEALLARVATVTSQSRPKAAVLYGPGDNLEPGWAPGAGTWVGDFLDLAHAENIAADTGNGWGQLSLESLVAAQPDVLLFPDGERAGAQVFLRQQLEQLKTHPAWATIPAVANDRLIILPAGPMRIPGPRQLDALEAIIEGVWPELAE